MELTVKENTISHADRATRAHCLGGILKCAGRSTPLIAGSVAMRSSSRQLASIGRMNPLERRAAAIPWIFERTDQRLGKSTVRNLNPGP